MAGQHELFPKRAAAGEVDAAAAAVAHPLWGSSQLLSLLGALTDGGKCNREVSHHGGKDLKRVDTTAGYIYPKASTANEGTGKTQGRKISTFLSR